MVTNTWCCTVIVQIMFAEKIANQR